MSDDNILEFPQQGDPDWCAFVGPFEEYRVCINGYYVPGLTVYPLGEDKFNLIVYRRFAAVFSKADAQQAALLIAHAQAIADGYSCHGEDSQPFNPHHMRMVKIETTGEPPDAR